MAEHPDPQDLADALAPVALAYVHRVRTDQPIALWRELVAPLDGWQQAALIALLAAAVDPTVHPDVLWGWVRHRDVITHPSPIVWDGGEEPIEDLPTDTIQDLLLSMARRNRPDAEIAESVGLSVNAVKKRRQRAGLFRTGRAGHRAGVG